MRRVADQYDLVFPPNRQRWHVVNGVGAVDLLDTSQNVHVRTRIVCVERPDLAGEVGSIYGGIGFVLRGIGVKQIDGTPWCLDVAEEGIVTERHAHNVGGIRHRCFDEATGTGVRPVKCGRGYWGK